MSYALPSRALPSRALPSRALPSRALPSRALPSRALLLIKNFSKPLTHPQWRKSKPIISTCYLYKIIRKRRQNISKYKPIYFMILNHIEDTDWYYTCQYIQQNGLDLYYLEYFRQYGVKYDSIVHNVEAIEGVTDAIETFNWLHKII